MKYLVFSDSHGNIINFRKAIEKHLEITTIIFLGDGLSDISVLKSIYKNHNFYAVTGNCDFYSSYANEVVLLLEGKKILMTHGHFYNVKTSTRILIEKGKKEEVDILLFGHTHLPMVNYEYDMLIVNPGSISRPKFSKHPSYAIIDIIEETSNAKIFYI